MNPNIGSTDRILRIIAGVVILGSFFFLEGSLRWLALIGIMPLGTALIRWCPAYALFGTDTCGTAHKPG
jgi:hypothetical protein